VPLGVRGMGRWMMGGGAGGGGGGGGAGGARRGAPATLEGRRARATAAAAHVERRWHGQLLQRRQPMYRTDAARTTRASGRPQAQVSNLRSWSRRQPLPPGRADATAGGRSLPTAAAAREQGCARARPRGCGARLSLAPLGMVGGAAWARGERCPHRRRRRLGRAATHRRGHTTAGGQPSGPVGTTRPRVRACQARGARRVDGTARLRRRVRGGHTVVGRRGRSNLGCGSRR